jgi:hypothetical protein
MSGETGGWLWLAVDVAFVALLAGALIYGLMMWHNRPRSPTREHVRDQATKELYHRPGNE